MPNALTVWKEPTGAVVSKSLTTPTEIVTAASALNSRDQRQITSAFEAESYEMVAGFILNKALSQLKKQLSSLGMEFVGEMLGRQDLDADSIPTTSISNFEAIKLAQELGFINSTDAKRLTQHTELLAHFDNLDPLSAEVEEMSREEAIGFLRTCVNATLGHTDNFAPKEFVAFRNALETRTFKEGDSDVIALLAAPYFFKRTTLSILLAGIKARSGAQYEHTLGNIVVIIPLIWPQLRDKERWSVGQAYAESVNSGSSASLVALKRALVANQGFDYVPETLRSQTFSAAASAVINVHSAANNFYNEPSALLGLVKLGSTIPWPAFPICMSAVFAVYLGNKYGYTFAAQADVSILLRRLTTNQWEYYFNECLPNDQLILQKMAWYPKPVQRFVSLVEEYDLERIVAKNKLVKNLIDAAAAGKDSAVLQSAATLLTRSAN